MGPLQVPKIFYDLFFEVFPEDPKNVRGIFVDQLSILFHKSAANFLGVSREDRVPV
jgi:hypothetical protein